MAEHLADLPGRDRVRADGQHLDRPGREQRPRDGVRGRQPRPRRPDRSATVAGTSRIAAASTAPISTGHVSCLAPRCRYAMPTGSASAPRRCSSRGRRSRRIRTRPSRSARSPPANGAQLSASSARSCRRSAGRGSPASSLETLPSNEQIAAQLGTPGATGTVKAALRRIYAKAGLSDQPAHAKRRALCRVARQNGWV